MFKRFVELARQEGVSHEENFPFWLEPEGEPRAGVVLVHGFSATPREMRPLAEALVEEGFVTLGVRLPGHGTTPEDLSRRSYGEWVATVAAALELLALQTPRLYAAGLSTGALSLLAATRDHPLSGMVLLAPFLRLRHPLSPYVWLLRHLLHYETREVDAELAPFYYTRRPLRAIHQLLRLVRAVRRLLPQLHTPALVITSQGDATADHRSAVRLFTELGSPRKQLQLLGPEVPHTLLGTDNPRRGEVIRMCCDFFDSLEKEKSGEGGVDQEEETTELKSAATAARNASREQPLSMR